MIIDARLLKWLLDGDGGVSSEAILFVMCGLSSEAILKRHLTPYPHDTADFARCYELLVIFPEWRKRIKEMRCLGKIWERISSAWEELEALYEQSKHTKLYERLQQLQPDDLEENCDVVSMGKGVRLSFSPVRQKRGDI